MIKTIGNNISYKDTTCSLEAELAQIVNPAHGDIAYVIETQKNYMYDGDTMQWTEQKKKESDVTRDEFEDLVDKVDELQLYKFPNATIVGEPTINNGQISGFSQTNYLRFPFLVDFKNKHFVIDIEFTTGANVVNQENIFDSDFGLAFAVRNARFVIAISSNGTSWNIGEGVGTYTVLPNTTYRVKLAWDGSSYTLAYSLDGGNTYITDITKASTEQPYPKQIFIGVGQSDVTVLNAFSGVINLNQAYLHIEDKLIWQGMDDVGLATRLSVDLDNIDPDGEAKIKKIVNLSDYVKKDGTKVLSTNDYTTAEKAEVAKVKDKVDIQQKVADAGKVLKIGVDGKLAPADDEKNTIVTSWEATPVDTKVPSEKLVKTELDKKIESIPDDVVRNYTTNNMPYYQLANEYGNNMWHHAIDADGVVTFYNTYTEEYTCNLYVFKMQYKKDIFDDLTKNNYILSDKEISWELSEYRPIDTWSAYYTSKGTGTKITIPNHSNIDRISLYITQKVHANSNYSFKLQNVQTRDTNPLPYMSPFPLGYNKPVDVAVANCQWPISSSRANQIYKRSINSAYRVDDVVSRSKAKKYTDDFMVGDLYCWIAEQSGYYRLYMAPDSEDNVYLITMGVGDDHKELVCTILYCSLWYSPFLTVLQYYGEGQVGWAYKDDDDREDFHPTNSRLTNEELVAGPCRLNNTNVSDTGNSNLIWVDLIGHGNINWEDIRVTTVELGSLW